MQMNAGKITKSLRKTWKKFLSNLEDDIVHLCVLQDSHWGIALQLILVAFTQWHVK